MKGLRLPLQDGGERFKRQSPRRAGQTVGTAVCGLQVGAGL